MTTQQDLHDLSVFDLAAKLAARDVSSVEVTQHFLARIRTEKLGAFLAVDADESLTQARAADARLAAGIEGGGAVHDEQIRRAGRHDVDRKSVV